MANELFLSLLKTSATVGTAVLALLLLSPLLEKKCRAKWKCLVWAILAVRLLVPLSLSLPRAPIKMELPAAAFSAPLAELEPASPLTTLSELPEQNALPEAENSETLPSGQPLSAMELAVRLWLLGCGVVLLWNAALCTALHFRIKREGQAASAEIRELGAAWAHRLGLKRSVSVVIWERAASPMALGFINSTLVLPRQDYESGELGFVLCHELTHIKRGDLWFKLLLLLAKAAHWFNPLVWLMSEKACEDLELYCDDAVTKRADFSQRRAYTEAILSSASDRSGAASVTTAFNGGKLQMKKRIINLLDTKKKGGAALPALVVLSVALLGVLVSCGIKAAEPVLPSSEPEQVVSAETPQTELAELTRRLGSQTLSYTGAQGESEVYLSSVTLKPEMAMVTYFTADGLPPYIKLDLPLVLICADGSEFPMAWQMFSPGALLAVPANGGEIPIGEVRSFIIGEQEFAFEEQEMSFEAPLENDENWQTPQLLSYCVCPEGVWSLICYHELAERLESDPVRTVAEICYMGYPMGESVENAQLKDSPLGFDYQTQFNLLYNILGRLTQAQRETALSAVRDCGIGGMEKAAALMAQVMEEMEPTEGEEYYLPQVGAVIDYNVSGRYANLEGYPTAAENDRGEQVDIYLTSFTIRSDSALLTFVGESGESMNSLTLPTLAAIGADGTEYPLTHDGGEPCMARYLCDEVPAGDIASLKIGSKTLLLSAPMHGVGDSGMLEERLKDIDRMPLPELLAFCCSAIETGGIDDCYGELAERFCAEPVKTVSLLAGSGLSDTKTVELIQRICDSGCRGGEMSRELSDALEILKDSNMTDLAERMQGYADLVWLNN